MEKVNIKNHSINDSWDYESYCDDLMTAFMENFEIGDGYARDLNDDEKEDAEINGSELCFMFTGKGIAIMDRYKSRLNKLGEKLFPGELIDIQCSGITQL